MNQNTLTVLLIEDNPDYAGLVQHWLSTTAEDVAFVLNWTDTLAAGLDRLAEGAVDVVLLDLGLPDSCGVETFLAIRAQAAGAPVIVLSGGEGESLALQMIQEGAEDYLVKSSCTAELLVKTLRYAVVRHKWQVRQANAAGAANNAKIIGVIGAKGGVGTTTVACNLAASLRRETGKEVLLADLDTNGLVSFVMNLDPQYSILDAVNNVDRLDRSCWGTIVTHSTNGLDIVTAPEMPKSGEITGEDLNRVVSVVAAFYDWIVIDLGRLNNLQSSLLEQLSVLFVVTTTALPALHEAKRVIHSSVEDGMNRDGIRLIVNQIEDVAALSGSELKQVFGIGVYATLSHGSQELHQACLQRKLPSENSNLGGQIGSLARKLAGISEKKPKRNLSGLLSFGGRFRKGAEARAI